MNELGKKTPNSAAPGQVSVLTVDDEAAGQRIDNFLSRACKGVPKSHIYRILRSGEVRVNKGRVDASYRLVEGDVVRVPPMRMASAESDAQVKRAPVPAATFEVLYEDDHLIAINKPSGTAVHGGSGVSFGVIEQMRAARPQAKFLELVHRLDRDTSGVLMLAKKRTALVGLHSQIRENRLDKRYFACVAGSWQPDWGNRRAVKAPLQKYVMPDGERRMRVQDDGLASHTVFNLLERFEVSGGRCAGPFALLEAELKTGRTHQIRVHLQSLELPIVGDDKYGDFALNKELARAGAKPALKRMFLHAHRLRITHPASGAPLAFDAPLPADCARFLQQLRDLSAYGTPAI
jgi:23S rRNA pseudouridine955/2504/2580 synthase